MVSVLVPAPIDEGQWTVFSPACSPDGRWIAYARVNMGDEQRFQINLVRPEGGSPQTIATGEVVAEPGLYADPLASPYAWSPDGSKFVFCLEKRGAPLLQIVSVGDTGVEGQPRVLATNAAYPMWGADGAEIIYTAFDGCREQLRTIRIAGNRSRVLKLKRALPLGVGGG